MWLRRIRRSLSSYPRGTRRIPSATLALEALESREVFSASPTISTFAGTGTVAGTGGKFGPATAGQLNFPQGMAVDAHGDVFIADAGNDLVREVTSTGTITTFAGNGAKGYTGDNGQALKAELNDPVAVAVDAHGDVFISDAGNQVIRKVSPSGIITTFAGTLNSPGYSGDGKAATAAKLNSPGGIAVNAAGDLFIADTVNNVVREVSTAGIITTFAGNGTAGYAGNGKAATQAELSTPTDVAVDSSGNVFIADSNNNAVREVLTTGIIRTIAGTGTPGYAGDGGRATKALLDVPVGVAVDSSGNVWISDNANDIVREVSGSTGVIHTVAGNGTYGYSGDGDGAPATQAELNGVRGLLVYQGNVLIADQYNDVIRQLTLTTLSPLTITPSLLPTGRVGVAYHQQLTAKGGTAPYTFTLLSGTLPPGLTLSSTGLITGMPTAFDTFNFTVQVSDNNHLSATLNFSLQINSSFTIGNLIATGNATPTGMAMDAKGDLFFADSLANRVYEVTTTGKFRLVAGNGAAGFRGDHGYATAAELNHPVAVAVDGKGDVFIADEDNQVIREVSPTGIISTLAGTPGKAGYTGNNGPANKAELDEPIGLAVDSSGDVFIADGLNNAVREVSTSGTITTVAGNGTAGYTGDTKQATAAQLDFPVALALDPSGNLYIADLGNDVVRKVTPGGIISTFAGNGFGGNSGDGGPAANGELEFPVGLATDRSGNVYIEDLYDDSIRSVNAATGIMDTIAGNGFYGTAGNGGPATAANLGLEAAGRVSDGNESYFVAGGMVVDSRGNLDVADENAGIIRRINAQAPVFISAAHATFTAGVQNAFSVAAEGFPAVVLSESTTDTLPPGVTFNAVTGVLQGKPPAGTSGTWTLHFTASNGTGHTATQIFTLIIPALPTVLTSPPLSVTVTAGHRVTLTASASGTPAPKVQWEVSTNGGATFRNILGATSTTLSFIATAAMNGRKYRAVFTNSDGQAISGEAGLVVQAAI